MAETCPICGNAVKWRTAIFKQDGELRTWLLIGVQSFPVGDGRDKPSECNWYTDMLNRAMHAATCKVSD